MSRVAPAGVHQNHQSPSFALVAQNDVPVSPEGVEARVTAESGVTSCSHVSHIILHSLVMSLCPGKRFQHIHFISQPHITSDDCGDARLKSPLL